MGKKASHEQSSIRIDQRVLLDPIVAAFVMLLSQPHHVVAECQQKVIVTKVVRPVKRVRFGNQPRGIFAKHCSASVMHAASSTAPENASTAEVAV